MDARIPATIKTGAEARAYAEKMESERRRKVRRRVAILAAFLVLGMSLGTIYATGFATNTGVTASSGNAGSEVLITNPGNAQDTSGLNGLISAGPSLEYTWSGRNGRFVNSQVMWTIDLTGQPLSNTHFLSVYLVDPMPVGFSDLQLQLRIAVDGDAGNATTCEGTDLDQSTTQAEQRVFTFDASDAQVTFNGLPGQERYCVGVSGEVAYPTNGRDPAGTFIRKSSNGQACAGCVFPSFVSTINRSN